MELDRKELKRRARTCMGRTAPSPWRITLLYLLLTSGVTLGVELVTGTPLALTYDTNIGGMFLYFLILLYSTVMSFGYDLWALRASREQPASFGTLIEGFSMAGRVVLSRVLVTVYTCLWYLAVAIPTGLVMVIVLTSTYSYSAALFAIVFFVAALLAALLVISLRYALVPYLLADYPDDGAGAAVRRSVEMMRGWKWELFKLELSFLGWQLLSGLLTTAGILAVTWNTVAETVTYILEQGGSTQVLEAVFASPLAVLAGFIVSLPLELWLQPYYSMTLAHFYTARAFISRQAPPVQPGPEF